MFFPDKLKIAKLIIIYKKVTKICCNYIAYLSSANNLKSTETK